MTTKVKLVGTRNSSPTDGLERVSNPSVGGSHELPVVPKASEMTPDSTPEPGGSRKQYQHAYMAYREFLRQKYGRSDFYKMCLTSEAARLAYLSGKARERGQYIARFYRNALLVLVEN